MIKKTLASIFLISSLLSMSSLVFAVNSDQLFAEALQLEQLAATKQPGSAEQLALQAQANAKRQEAIGYKRDELNTAASALEKQAALYKQSGDPALASQVQALEAQAAALRAQAKALSGPGDTKAVDPKDATAATPTAYDNRYKLIVPIPGVEGTDANPLKYISAVYNYSIGIGSLIAVAVIVFAGFKWALSRGNMGAVGEAKDMLKNAILGLVMLLGATAILSLISPSLTTLTLPKLEPVKSTAFNFGAGDDSYLKALDDLDKLKRAQASRRVQIDGEIAELSKQKEAIKGEDVDSQIKRQEIDVAIARLQEEDWSLAYDNLLKIYGVRSAEYDGLDDDAQAQYQETLNKALAAANQAKEVRDYKRKILAEQEAKLAEMKAKKK